MFVRKLRVDVVDVGGERRPMPLGWLDSFAMRNFTNDACFDDTLPLADGVLEAGYRVPLDALARGLEEWARKKGWLGVGERVEAIDRDG